MTSNDSPTFADEVEADELAEERAAIEAIETLYGLRQGRKEFEDVEKKARVPIDNWFRSHPGETRLGDDNERGYVAMLRPGGKTVTYDHPRVILGSAPALYRRLFDLGCVRIDADAVKRNIAEGLLSEGDMAPWRTEGERTPALIVERVDS
jgi:hypothetical protein